MALFDSSHVIDGLEVADQDAVFEALAQKAVELGVTSDASAVVADLRAREGEASTGFGDGIAIPHAKSASVARAAVVVLKNAEPLDWPSFDEKPVTCAIALMVPDGEAGSEHIRLLSKTATLLMNGGFKGLVHQSSDPAEIAAAIQKGIEG